VPRIARETFYCNTKTSFCSGFLLSDCENKFLYCKKKFLLGALNWALACLALSNRQKVKAVALSNRQKVKAVALSNRQKVKALSIRQSPRTHTRSYIGRTTLALALMSPHRVRIVQYQQYGQLGVQDLHQGIVEVL